MYNSDYMTPSPGISPLTPGLDYSPRTPGSPMEATAEDMLPTDIEVAVKDNYHVRLYLYCMVGNFMAASMIFISFRNTVHIPSFHRRLNMPARWVWSETSWDGWLVSISMTTDRRLMYRVAMWSQHNQTNLTR